MNELQETIARAAAKMRALATDPRFTAAMDGAVATGIAAWLGNSMADYRPPLDPAQCPMCGEYCCDPIDLCGCHPGDALTVARSILGEWAAR